MSLSVFDHDDGRFRLVRDAREIGWVQGRTVCFRGFADADAARAAASAAYGALTTWTAWQLRAGPASSRHRLALRRDDGTEWLTLGASRVGRLRRLDADGVADAPPEVAFEIDLPARIAGSLALSAAQIMDRALQAHAAGRDERPRDHPIERPVERDADRAAERAAPVPGGAMSDPAAPRSADRRG